MNGDKQIEEIKSLADDIYINCPACLLQDESEMIARYVIETQGYRKASKVAREILQEVRQLLLNMVLANSMGETYDLEGKFAELERNTKARERDEQTFMDLL